MLVHLKIIWTTVFLLLSSHVIKSEKLEEIKDDLEESESKDPTKVEIIKEIKRINEDGSYTFGYEAEDGTFKVESRDVLGNIKGTFGYVDSDGEIKRVSYSSTNNSETATVSSEKEKSTVIQQIPKINRTSSILKRPTIIYPNVASTTTSTVIQSIPRKRTFNPTSINNSSAFLTNTDRSLFKNAAKSPDYETATTIRSTEASATRSASSIRPEHYVRSTTTPQTETQRFTEGQLIRPTQIESVTPRPNEKSQPRRFIATRQPFLDEAASSTIKPITEETFEDTMRGNLLRRQLNQEKISNFDTREHVLNLQQSVGDDSTDVYSASLTTGTPRPLFTTTDRPRIFSLPSFAPTKGATPAKYHSIFQKPQVRRPTQPNIIQETTTDATNTENNYVTPSPVPVLHLPNSEESIPVVQSRYPFHRGAILIPINQIQNGRYIVEDSNNRVQQQPEYITQYIPEDQQYLRETSSMKPVAIQFVPRRQLIADPIPYDDYPRSVENMYVPRQAHPVRFRLNINEFQDEIDNIKPPVSTKDFQKLLNRLILRQKQLQEISKLEYNRFMHDKYQRISQTPPVSVFVRSQPDSQNNGPVQFISESQNPRSKQFPSNHIPMQHLMESQQQFNTIDIQDSEVYSPFRKNRRVARLLPMTSKSENIENNYLPADVREMLLLRMLQLAINPNLPLPPNEGDTMTSAIRQYNNNKGVRNVEILGEERDEEKSLSRNKRYRESEEYEYY